MNRMPCSPLSRGRRSFVRVMALAILLSACGDDTTAPKPATLAIRVATSGDDADADGYQVLIPGMPARTVSANDSIDLAPFPPGEYEVELYGAANNCAVQDNPRRITVGNSGEAKVGFVVTCRSRADALRVNVTTSGTDQDFNGYTVTVAGYETRVAGRISATIFRDLPPAGVTVSLGGVNPNCAIEGGAVRQLTIPATGTGVVNFSIVCSSNVGTLIVRTITTGSDIDPDGYFVFAPGVERRAIATTTTATISSVRAGTQAIRLGAVAQNCTVEGGESRNVAVSFGGTVEVEFRVACTASTGPYYTIAFERNRAEAPRVCTVRSDGLQEQCVTTTYAYAPTWRPDGSRFGYWTNGDIYTNTIGGVPERLTFTANHFETDPQWSKDGSRITYEASGRIYVMSANATDTVFLGAGTSPVFSPDGSRIVFERFDARPLIYTMTVTGTDVRQVTSDWYNWDPSYSPDGSKILFGAYRDAAEGIFVMNTDGTGVTRLAGLGASRFARYSADGAKIFFVKEIDGGTDIFMANPDGTGIRRVTSNTVSERPAPKP